MADKLVRVHTLDGVEQWVLIHVEVQARHDHHLPQRIFTYSYRIYDRYKHPVASLVVLADRNPYWRPSVFSFKLFGCTLELRFRTTKLQDLADHISTLLEDHNPFALLTAAHLLTQETHGLPSRRLAAKRQLTRLLLARDWDRQRIVNLFHVVDWIMHLPTELEAQLWQDMAQTQGRPTMENYIPRGARIVMRRELAEAKVKAALEGRQEGMQQGRQEGMQQGRQEGIQQGIQQGMQQGRQEGIKQGQAALLALQLSQRFGALPDDITALLSTASENQLQDWAKAVIDAPTLNQVFARH
jgi:hypothetical protein